MEKYNIQRELEIALCDFPKHYNYRTESDPCVFYFMNLEGCTFFIRKSRRSYDLVISDFSDMEYVEKKLHVKAIPSNRTKYILFQVFNVSEFELIVRKFYSLSYLLLNYYKNRLYKQYLQNKRGIQSELCFSYSS